MDISPCNIEVNVKGIDYIKVHARLEKAFTCVMEYCK